MTPPAGARITREEEAEWRRSFAGLAAYPNKGLSIQATALVGERGLRLLSALTAASGMAEALEKLMNCCETVAHTGHFWPPLIDARAALAAFREKVEE